VDPLPVMVVNVTPLATKQQGKIRNAASDETGKKNPAERRNRKEKPRRAGPPH
jgi:hypothetical protein